MPLFATCSSCGGAGIERGVCVVCGAREQLAVTPRLLCPDCAATATANRECPECGGAGEYADEDAEAAGDDFS